MTQADSPPPELHRPITLAQIGAGIEREVTASESECAAIAARLLIPAVGALSCRFRLTPQGDGAIQAVGTLLARVTRECVVTLELFEATLREDFHLRFVPVEQFVEEDEDLLDLDADDEVPYHGIHIDLGEAAVEQLALALDPYPRMPGAELPDSAEDDAAASPFAALARRARQG